MTRSNSAPRAPSYLVAGLIAIVGGVACAGAALAQAPAQTAPSATSQPTGTAAMAPDTAEAQAPAAKPKRRGARMVCKQEAILGTRLKSTRTCRTADEWRRISRGFQDQLKNTTDKGGAVFSSN
ncbi:MAG TPA: hypothetical protein DIU09_03985 [Hyphomonadaceae bacterium]|nr:hypothetical protein AEM38_09710 [Hyphomonadaceae bacterium UKL13-1]OYU52711.1 MAG: hypothetical protein CFE27_04975 [Alphaproteobacteria bacterium PA1]HCP63732.1 hypothetical protein [Hyphomonadaceae bacterium]